MATKVKRPAQLLMTHRDIAAKLGVKVQFFRDQVAKGIVPPPHSILGSMLMYEVWMVEHYIKHRRWPERGSRAAATEGRGEE